MDEADEDLFQHRPSRYRTPNRTRGHRTRRGGRKKYVLQTEKGDRIDSRWGGKTSPHGRDLGGRLALALPGTLQSARYTIFPPTIVATTFPVNCHPSNGVLCDSDRDLAASNVQRFLGSKMVTSAMLPRASDPRPGRSKTRAGPAVKSSTMRVSGILCSRCSFVIARASAVSRPVMPKDACSNSTCFSCVA